MKPRKNMKGFICIIILTEVYYLNLKQFNTNPVMYRLKKYISLDGAGGMYNLHACSAC